MVDVVQHCFGSPGSGGPATALSRLLAGSKGTYPVVWQRQAAGGFSVNLLRSLTQQFRSHRPRLVHVRGLGNEGFHAALAAKLAGVPEILVSIHGTHRDLQLPGRRLQRWIVTRVLEPATLRLATAIVTVCRSAAQRDFLTPYRAKLLDPVANGVPLPDLPDLRGADVRHSLGIATDRLVLVVVSRMTVEKGYLDLADALKRLDDKGVTADLIAVGGGDDSGAIRNLFDGLNGIRVHFVGHKGDVAPYLAASDVFVFPSWHENLSNALLEAMSYGLPVVATDVGGNREVVQGGGGVLIPAHDPGALAEAIEKMVESEDRRSDFGKAARVNIEHNYSSEIMVAAWEATYRQLLDRRQ